VRQEKAATVSAIAILSLAFALPALQPAQAQTFSILHVFTGGKDGGGSRGPLIEGPDHQLYGASTVGGKYLEGNLFKMTEDGKHETLLDSFKYWNGYEPNPYLILDPSGTIYGATSQGGANGDIGTFYEVISRNHEKVIHQFPYNVTTDGNGPAGAIAVDAQGNYYGATSGGGANGSGTIYKIDPSGNETVLYNFSPANVSGGDPGGLVLGPDGDLYGTAGCSYSCYSGGGTVFKVDMSGNLTTLYAFSGGSDGNDPGGALLFDAAGNIYGTTFFGGTGPCNTDGYAGCGTIFKLAPNGTETVLYNFQGSTDGAFPSSGVIADGKGNIYGVTLNGGDLNLYFNEGCGVAYELNTQGQESVLHTFESGDGCLPEGELLRSRNVLYGVAFEGGSGDGTVFKIDLK
jgi:uncharacterized repeat protein (TIGR03803 family)